MDYITSEWSNITPFNFERRNTDYFFCAFSFFFSTLFCASQSFGNARLLVTVQSGYPSFCPVGAECESTTYPTIRISVRFKDLILMRLKRRGSPTPQ